MLTSKECRVKGREGGRKEEGPKLDGGKSDDDGDEGESDDDDDDSGGQERTRDGNSPPTGAQIQIQLRIAAHHPPKRGRSPT